LGGKGISMTETLYDALYRLYFKEDDLNLFFEKYRHMAFNYLEKTGWAKTLGYHNCQDVVQHASFKMLLHRERLIKENFTKEQLAGYCFGEVKFGASEMYYRNNKYVQDPEELLLEQWDMDSYFNNEMTIYAAKLISTYKIPEVQEAIALYFFQEKSLKYISEKTKLQWRGLKHLMNIFLIDMKNRFDNQNLTVEDYLKNEAPKNIFTQRKLREYIERKTT
jgi:hypothetical protein